MYIAGLDVHDLLARSPLSHAQGVEGIVWWTTLAGVLRAVRRHTGKGAHHPNTRRILPTDVGKTGVPAPLHDTKNIGYKPSPPILVKILSPLAHGFIILTPVVYLLGTGFGRLEQPEWFSNWSLMDGEDAFGFGGLATIRTLACIVNYGALNLWKQASREIRRASLSPEPSLPQDGPYSIVRHPMSSAILLGQATYALMWWNTVPLVGLGITAAYLAASLPHEEEVIEADILTGAEYARYKKRVTSKVIPYIW